MEAVGFASSVIALAEAASTTYKYVKDSPRDHAELQSSIAALPGLLTGLKAPFYGLSPNDGWSTEMPKLADRFDLLCKILQKVEKKFDPSASRTGKVIQMLKWPLDKAEVIDLLQQVERVKSFIMLAIQNDHLALSQAIHQGVQQITEGMKQIHAHNMDADLHAFSEWLSPIDCLVIQQNHFLKCAPGIGYWLPAHPEFKH
ncbi:hypothetical protein C8J56DRAFT_1113121 [Mycena floridula]|nr:hypothetical protein C8J56DRAFT_1113121 [Mycena floridula]